MSPILQQISEKILPKHYKKNLTNLVDSGWMFHIRGAYVFLAIPFDQVPSEDYNSEFARAKLKDLLTCIPIIREKGLFLLYYGEKSKWVDRKRHIFPLIDWMLLGAVFGFWR